MRDVIIFGGAALIAVTMIIGCTEDTISKQEKRAAKEAAKAKKEQVDTPAEIELGGELSPEVQVMEPIEKQVHVTYTTVPTDSSYWYVILKDDVTNWHGTVELPTPYFDFNEARRQFNGAKGKGYFKFILQINKESASTFYTYKD